MRLSSPAVRTRAHQVMTEGILLMPSQSTDHTVSVGTSQVLKRITQTVTSYQYQSPASSGSIQLPVPGASEKNKNK